ncbi:MAG: OFA family MFS transporter [Nitrososphaerota archaeon]
MPGGLVNRWIYPPIGLVINLMLGTIYSWSVFRKPLESFFGWSAVESGLPFTVFLLAFALLMPLGGKLMEVLGPRKTSLMGGALVGLGWFLTSLVADLPEPLIFTLIFYGVIAGAGVGIAYGVPISVSSKWIPERRGLAVGVTILGFGLSPLITAPIANRLIYEVGVMRTFAYLGIIFGALLIVLSIPLSFPPESWAPPSTSAQAAKTRVLAELAPRQMIRTLTFYGLWLSYALGTLGGFTAISLAAKYGQEVVKLTPELAAAATAAFAAFNGAGRPAFGYLCDRLGVRKTALISFLIIFAAALAATQAHILPLYLISFALLWLVFGGWLAIAPAGTSTFFGLKHLGTNYGIIFTGYGAGALIGPTLASYLQTITGSYSPAFLTTAVLAVIGLMVSAATLRPPKA